MSSINDIPEDIFNLILHEIKSNYTRHDFMIACKYTHQATQKWRDRNWRLYGVPLQPYHLEISRKKHMYIPDNHRLFILLHACQLNIFTIIVTYKVDIKKWNQYLKEFNNELYNPDPIKSRVICEIPHKTYFNTLIASYTMDRAVEFENPSLRDELIKGNKIVIMSLSTFKKVQDDDALIIVNVDTHVSDYDMKIYTNNKFNIPKNCVRLIKHSDNIPPTINVVKSNKITELNYKTLYYEFLSAFNLEYVNTICIYSPSKLNKCNTLPANFDYEEYGKNPNDQIFKITFTDNDNDIYIINDNYIDSRIRNPFDNIIILNSKSFHSKLLNKGSNHRRIINALYIDTSYEFMLRKRMEKLNMRFGSMNSIIIYINLLELNIYDLSDHDIKVLFSGSYYDKYKSLAQWHKGTDNKLTEKQVCIILQVDYQSSKFKSKLETAKKLLDKKQIKELSDDDDVVDSYEDYMSQ